MTDILYDPQGRFGPFMLGQKTLPVGEEYLLYDARHGLTPAQWNALQPDDILPKRVSREDGTSEQLRGIGVLPATPRLHALLHCRRELAEDT